MRIQHNIAAMNAYRNYNTNTSAVSKNLEKLSSGYKINRAGDDAAGLAISEKMRAQISGLNAASKNVKDGISLVKTAEGAMQEVQDMLNRMVTLSTQSANGTYDNEVDRANLQKEVDQLRAEINRIADSSNFNGIKLLDGSQEIKTSYTNLSSPSATQDLGFKIISDGQLGVDAQAGVFSYDLSQLKITVGGGNAATNPNGIQNLAGGQVVSDPDWIEATGATVAASGNALRLVTTQAGDGASLGYAAAPSSGTDVSALLGLTSAKAASNIPGYTPGDLVSEIGLIQTAARCAGNAVYGWVIDAQYRDTDEQKAVADWAEGQSPAIFGACTNAPNAYDTANTTNIGCYAMNSGYRRTFTFYHDNPQVYPEMSYLALALSVNYALNNATLTMKFKQLPGISTVPLTETQLAALESRRINTYVSIGNTSSVVREGVQAAADWFTDSLVNLDNYKEELQVEVYNVFLRNKKVPYTQAGQNLLVSAAAKINRRYTDNGTFAPRDVESDATETGYDTLPATSITPASVAGATMSERAARIAPPIAITAYEAGAFHSVAIAVSVYN